MGGSEALFDMELICNSRFANQNRREMLKSQDLVVLCRLLIARRRAEVISYPLLSQWTGLSASETHASVRRSLAGGLLTRFREEAVSGFAINPVISACEEFLFHGLKYVFPLSFSSVVRGVPTGTNAPGMNEGNLSVLEAEAWVWPHAEGSMRGIGITPLYRSVPDAALKDETLHQALASLDLIRSSSHRLRRLGEEWLKTQLLRP